jgi:hypothetical protein
MEKGFASLVWGVMISVGIVGREKKKNQSRRAMGL